MGVAMLRLAFAALLLTCVSAMSHHRLMHEAKHIMNGMGSSCINEHCYDEAKNCGTEWSCIKAGACNADCQFFHKKTSESCNLLCELNYGYNSTKYRELMQCMSDHGCLPLTNKSDGLCLAQDNQTIQNLTSL